MPFQAPFRNPPPGSLSAQGTVRGLPPPLPCRPARPGARPGARPLCGPGRLSVPQTGTSGISAAAPRRTQAPVCGTGPRRPVRAESASPPQRPETGLSRPLSGPIPGMDTPPPANRHRPSRIRAPLPPYPGTPGTVRGHPLARKTLISGRFTGTKSLKSFKDSQIFAGPRDPIPLKIRRIPPTAALRRFPTRPGCAIVQRKSGANAYIIEAA